MEWMYFRETISCPVDLSERVWNNILLHLNSNLKI